MRANAIDVPPEGALVLLSLESAKASSATSVGTPDGGGLGIADPMPAEWVHHFGGVPGLAHHAPRVGVGSPLTTLPEPASLLLLGTALLGAAVGARRLQGRRLAMPSEDVRKALSRATLTNVDRSARIDVAPRIAAPHS
ncbi:MAG: PEP-CTERM sorting domain-containing protein [Vicinamibacterales bacterium]